jgi:hypothetical protein
VVGLLPGAEVGSTGWRGLIPTAEARSIPELLGPGKLPLGWLGQEDVVVPGAVLPVCVPCVVTAFESMSIPAARPMPLFGIWFQAVGCWVDELVDGDEQRPPQQC